MHDYLMRRRARGQGRRAFLPKGLLTAVVLLGLGAGGAEWLSRQERSGAFRALDGDSLRFEGLAVRLAGIDAPELDQSCQRAEGPWACGREARAALAALASGGTVTCTWRKRDRYGRPLARCAAGATDLGRAMVEAGLAVAYGDHAAEERAARAARRGLWAGEFEQPQAWRKRHPRH